VGKLKTRKKEVGFQSWSEPRTNWNLR